MIPRKFTATFAIALLCCFAPCVSAVAQVRFIHGLAMAEPVDIVVDGDVVAPGLAFGEASPILELPAGSYNVLVLTSANATVVSDLGDLDLADDKIYNAAVVLGPTREPTTEIRVLNSRTAVAGMSRLTAFHGFGVAPPFKIFAVPADQTLADLPDSNPIPYGQLLRFGLIPSGVYSLFVFLDDETDTKGRLMLQADGVSLPAEADLFLTLVNDDITSQAPVQFILAIGSEETPSVLVDDSRPDMTIESPAPDATALPVATTSPSPLPETTPTPVAVSETSAPSMEPSESEGPTVSPSEASSETDEVETNPAESETDGPTETAAEETENGDPVATEPATAEPADDEDETSEPGEAQDSEVCIGVESTINGRPILAATEAFRMQVHPLSSSSSMSKVLCTSLGSDRLCATPTHIVALDGEHMYMRDFCNGAIVCTHEVQNVFNVKTDSGIVADYTSHNVQVTHSAARLSISNHVSAARIVATERTIQRYMTPVWKLLTQ